MGQGRYAYGSCMRGTNLGSITMSMELGHRVEDACSNAPLIGRMGVWVRPKYARFGIY